GLRIGFRFRRGRRRNRIRVDGKPPRPIVAELLPGRGGARAAIEDEGDRTAGAIGAVELIGGVGNIGLRFALFVEQADRAGGRGESKRAARKIEGLPGRRIWRELVLLGGRRRRRSAAAARRRATLLSRRRGCGRALRRRVVRASAHESRAEHDQDADGAGDWRSDGHDLFSPGVRQPAKKVPAWRRFAGLQPEIATCARCRQGDKAGGASNSGKLPPRTPLFTLFRAKARSRPRQERSECIDDAAKSLAPTSSSRS